MPHTNPRIIVVDARQSLIHLVRAALELMGRRPRLIETYTGDDAMLELKLSSPDMLITAQTLGDATNGPVLALMAKRELAALPVIVMGDETDPEIDTETLAESPFQYLRRPFAPELFIRTLRIALDGPEAAPRETAPEEIIPVPPIDHDKLKSIMFRLMRDVGAMAVVLADRNGKVVTYEGAAGYIDRDMLAATLASGFGSIMKLLPILGDQPRVLKHYDGERGNLFGLALGLHHFLMLFFEGNAPASALGNVKRFGGAAVNEMLGNIGDVAFDPKPMIKTATISVPKVEPPHPRRKGKTRTQEMKVMSTPEPASAPPSPAKPAQAAPIQNFDPSLFDSLDKIDLREADELFDPNKLVASVSDASGDKISFDDARLQGIIGDIDDYR